MSRRVAEPRDTHDLRASSLAGHATCPRIVRVSRLARGRAPRHEGDGWMAAKEFRRHDLNCINTIHPPPHVEVQSEAEPRDTHNIRANSLAATRLAQAWCVSRGSPRGERLDMREMGGWQQTVPLSPTSNPTEIPRFFANRPCSIRMAFSPHASASQDATANRPKTTGNQ
jgi:hypothetical protein